GGLHRRRVVDAESSAGVARVSNDAVARRSWRRAARRLRRHRRRRDRPGPWPSRRRRAWRRPEPQEEVPRSRSRWEIARGIARFQKPGATDAAPPLAATRGPDWPASPWRVAGLLRIACCPTRTGP